jgi:hypothetical protein
MPNLIRTVIDGRHATIVYLDAWDGKIVRPAEARVAIVRYDDGGSEYLTLDDEDIDAPAEAPTQSNR